MAAVDAYLHYLRTVDQVQKEVGLGPGTLSYLRVLSPTLDSIMRKYLAGEESFETLVERTKQTDNLLKGL